MCPRPRSPRVHEAMLEAALGLFAERGFEGASMDAIAEAAGVSKATVYNHWADKDALCLEALERLHGLDREPPSFESGDVRADLLAAVEYQPAPERAELQCRVMPHLIAYSARNRAFARTWRTRVLGPPRARLLAILRRAVDQGALSEDLDLELAVAMLIGPLMYREIFRGVRGPLPDDTPARLVAALWDAYGARRRFKL